MLNENNINSKNIIMMIDDLYIMKKLGSGGFGDVYKCYFKDKPDVLYACKKMSKSIIKEKKLERFLINELDIIKKLDNTNICRYIDKRESVNSYYLVFELLEVGTLSDIIKQYNHLNYNFKSHSTNSVSSYKGFTIDLVQNYFKQIAFGVKYLHDNNILHRDLKPDNILGTITKTSNSHSNDNNISNDSFSQITLKLIDFGFSRYLNNEEDIAQTTLGSPFQMAPNILTKIINKIPRLEPFKYSGYKQDADIWALGCIFVEILTGNPPFAANNYHTIYEKLKKGYYYIPPHYSNSSKRKKQADISIELLCLINRILISDSNQRVTINDIVSSKFMIKDINDLLYLEYSSVVDCLNEFYYLYSIKYDSKMKKNILVNHNHSNSKDNGKNNHNSDTYDYNNYSGPKFCKEIKMNIHFDVFNSKEFIEILDRRHTRNNKNNNVYNDFNDINNIDDIDNNGHSNTIHNNKQNKDSNNGIEKSRDSNINVNVNVDVNKLQEYICKHKENMKEEYVLSCDTNDNDNGCDKKSNRYSNKEYDAKIEKKDIKKIDFIDSELNSLVMNHLKLLDLNSNNNSNKENNNNNANTDSNTNTYTNCKDQVNDKDKESKVLFKSFKLPKSSSSNSKKTTTSYITGLYETIKNYIGK